MCQTWLLSVIFGFFKGFFQKSGNTLHHLLSSGELKNITKASKIFFAQTSDFWPSPSEKASRANPRPSSTFVAKKLQAKKKRNQTKTKNGFHQSE